MDDPWTQRPGALHPGGDGFYHRDRCPGSRSAKSAAEYLFGNIGSAPGKIQLAPPAARIIARMPA